MNKHVHKGALFIELLIVISIIMLFTSLSYSCKWHIDHIMVRNETYHMYSLCYFLQQAALSTQTTHILTIDAHNNTINTFIGQHIINKNVIFGFGHLNKNLARQQTTKPITFVNHTIYFYPNGTISSGSIYLTDKSHNTCYALTCPIGSTSTLRIYRFADNHWIKVT